MRKLIELLKKLFGMKKEQDKPSITDTGETAESGETIETSEPSETGETEQPPVVVVPETEPKKEYKIHVLLDNGHASSTPGKRSQKLEDGRQFFEYEFNRDIVRRVVEKLDTLGVPYEIITPEVDVDVPLRVRSQRANRYCNEYGAENCLFLSVHSNAAGNGEWKTAKGFCCYTSKGETASDEYAEIFMREAEKVLVPLGKTLRKCSQKKYSWEENFSVLVLTKCPAVLTENLFFDNKEEVKFLLSEEGREAIAQYHVNAILEIENLRA